MNTFAPQKNTSKFIHMEIQEIKSKLTLAQVLQHYGLKPDKNLRLNCRFHEDKTHRRRTIANRRWDDA